MINSFDMINVDAYTMDTLSQEECEKFGSVKSVHIPRPSTMNDQEKPGVGYVFVAFGGVDSSAKAAASLRARTFDGRKVRAPVVLGGGGGGVDVSVSVLYLMAFLYFLSFELSLSRFFFCCCGKTKAAAWQLEMVCQKVRLAFIFLFFVLTLPPSSFAVV